MFHGHIACQLMMPLFQVVFRMFLKIADTLFGNWIQPHRDTDAVQ